MYWSSSGHLMCLMLTERGREPFQTERTPKKHGSIAGSIGPYLLVFVEMPGETRAAAAKLAVANSSAWEGPW